MRNSGDDLVTDSPVGDLIDEDHSSDEDEDENADASWSSFEKCYQVRCEEAVSLQHVYVLRVDACVQDASMKVVAGLSDYRCAVYDVDAQMRVTFSRDAHRDVITDVKIFADEPHRLYSGSLDGTVKLWDTRTKAGPAVTFKEDSDGAGDGQLKPISCFDVSCDRKFVCGGTPLLEADAYLLFWDARKSSALGGYWETHTDDVTQVRFSGRLANRMLSGSVDGLVNVFDVGRSSEDDALTHSLNAQVAVRQLRWLDGERSFGCVTDMETVQMWRVDDAQPFRQFDRRTLAHAMRLKSSNSAYVCDVHAAPGADEVFVLGGSNAGKGDRLKLAKFADDRLSAYATFERNKQLVRCSHYDAQRDTFVTGGESGIVSVWRPGAPATDKACLKERVQKKKRRQLKNDVYPDRRAQVERLQVPGDKVRWQVEWPSYDPPAYTSAAVLGQRWADPDLADGGFQPRWNSVDGRVNRVSYTAPYAVHADDGPLNVVGRTGLKGRGLLGRWGPNHAADPIVTRWKRADACGAGQRVLQFVAIRRRDGGGWAIPGGMVDAGETVTESLKREFMEEGLNVAERTPAERSQLRQRIERLFAQGDVVYRGYVDDPRNTDNAWMETTAVHFHDERDESVGRLPLEAGDDAVGVQWMDVGAGLKLYASHADWIRLVADKMDARW